MDYSQQDVDFTNNEGTIYQEDSIDETPPSNNPINNPKSLTSEDNYMFQSPPGANQLRIPRNSDGSFQNGQEIFQYSDHDSNNVVQNPKDKNS